MWKEIRRKNEIKDTETLKIDKAYKRLKKISVAAYRFPKELSAATGFESMSLDGIACSGMGRYSVCYQVSGLQPGNLPRQLREHDFSVEISKEHIAANEIHLAVYAYESNMEDAKAKLEDREEVLAGIIQKNHGTMERLDFTSRMNYVHNCLAYEVGTLRLIGFHQQVSGSRLPNRTYTSQRIRLSMNHLDSLVSCKSSKQSGQSARDFLRISNIFFSNISLPFSDFSVLTWCIHKYSACSPHISHFPALIRLIIVCLLSYFL